MQDRLTSKNTDKHSFSSAHSVVGTPMDLAVVPFTGVTVEREAETALSGGAFQILARR